MTVRVEVTQRCRERMGRRYHVCRVRLGLELHRFVCADKDEEIKFRRRLHVHLCLFSLSSALAFLNSLSVVGVDTVVLSSVGTQLGMEFFDYVGRF